MASGGNNYETHRSCHGRDFVLTPWDRCFGLRTTGPARRETSEAGKAGQARATAAGTSPGAEPAATRTHKATRAPERVEPTTAAAATNTAATAGATEPAATRTHTATRAHAAGSTEPGAAGTTAAAASAAGASFTRASAGIDSATTTAPDAVSPTSG